MLKLKSILFEEIVIPPREMKSFLENLSKRVALKTATIMELRKGLNLLSDDVSEIEDKERFLERKLIDLELYDKLDFRSLKYSLDFNFRNAVKPFSETIVEKIDDNAKGILEAETVRESTQYIRYLVETLEFFVKDVEEFIAPWQLVAETDFTDAKLEFMERFEGGKNEEFFDVLKAISAELVSLLDLVKQYAIPKLERRIEVTYKSDAKPATNKVELLYHATVNADSLMKTGFVVGDANSTKNSEGIGGSNLDASGKKSISFTADIYIAKEIARCLKEAVMIAHGEIDIYDLITYAMQDGVAQEIERNFGFFSNEENLARATTKQVFDYYRYYLLASPKRYDPLFFDSDHLMELFKTKQVEDVGVVVCQVDMTNPRILYLRSMEEFRVPPEAVIKVTKVLR
jgi:hypothetical protein